MKTYTVTFITVMYANTAEEAAHKVGDGLRNNEYKNIEFVVEYEEDSSVRPSYIPVEI